MKTISNTQLAIFYLLRAALSEANGSNFDHALSVGLLYLSNVMIGKP